jgi:tRNA (Thr-GGU) A37 N-methylase
VVRLLSCNGSILDVAEIDILDGTPLLDIKPYVPEFDAFTPSKAGWLDTCGDDRRVADSRFHDTDEERQGLQGGPVQKYSDDRADR